jgi:hypothetical protein
MGVVIGNALGLVGRGFLVKYVVGLVGVYILA